VDLGSRVGITIDGLAAPSGWVESGSIIGIGPYRIRLDGRKHGQEPATATLPNPLGRSQATDGDSLLPMALERPRKTPGARRSRIRQVLTLVGRAPDCRLQIRDQGISRYHAVL